MAAPGHRALDDRMLLHEADVTSARGSPRACRSPAPRQPDGVADDRAPDGRPDSVPVWFLLRDDETILVYSQAVKTEAAQHQPQPRLALGLDVTDLGRDIIRIDATAEHAPAFPATIRCRSTC
jgi:hypothetical protein